MTRPGPGRPARQRVVLAHRRGTRMVHTRVEVAEQTGVGDALVRGLVRAQFGLAIRLALLTVGALAAVALAITLIPGADSVEVAGIRLHWLFLGALVYPGIYAVGRLYIRLAEQGENDFVAVVDQGGGP